MREKKPALVIAFETTSQALAAEALFTSSGLPGRVIPLPSCISAGCGLAWKAEPEQQESGDVFETLSLTDLDGNEVDSSVFEDYDLTMINIWATFCNPCLSEMPELAELSSEYAAGDNNVQIIGICTDITDIEGQPVQEGVDLAKQIVELTGASYRHLVPDADLMEFLMQEVAVVPTTYFVDSQGKVVGEATLGARDKASWQQEIDARLAMLEE